MEIIIEQDTYRKMNHLLMKGLKVSSEVSGYANVDVRDEGQTFYITDAIMPKQTGNGGETEIDDVAKNRLMYQRREMPFGMKCHWHTHPRMSTFWSATDKTLIKKLGEGGWMIFLVMNEKEEIRGAFYEIVEHKSVGGRYVTKQEVFLDNVDVLIEVEEIDKALTDSWDAEFDESHSKIVHSYVNQGGQIGFPSDGYRSGHWDKKQQKWISGGSITHPYQHHHKAQVIAPMSERELDHSMGFDILGGDDEEELDGFAGWYNYGGTYLYNPLKDETCNNFNERVESMIRESSWDECAQLIQISSKFGKFFNKAIESYGEGVLKNLMGEY